MEQHPTLHLPENFCNACRNFSIHPLEALQFYISKSTVYANLVKPTDMLLAVSANIFEQWLQSTGATKGKMGEFNRLISMKYVKWFMRLVMAKISAEKKEKAYKRLIEKWYNSLEPHLPPKTLATASGLTVLLTRDFCVLCDLFRGTPAKVLQHYVNHVTLSACIESPIELAMPTGFFLQYPPILNQIKCN